MNCSNRVSVCFDTNGIQAYVVTLDVARNDAIVGGDWFADGRWWGENVNLVEDFHTGEVWERPTKLSYLGFQDEVREFVRKARIDSTIWFGLSGNGRFVAIVGGHARLYGNRHSRAITVRWGSGHQAIVRV